MWSEESEERRIDIWQTEEQAVFHMFPMRAVENNQELEPKKETGEKLEAIKGKRESKLIY
ncbi:MAG: hypothetical protein US14_C0007G0002 [candidate division WS6 bacterium GW2011_WS6_36_26]|nr:MAG: hypothetical protein US14_C0007G0002 [candidate division WS6 bacterium GW2011_WS6_36_26]HAM37279.1 hypothetical protein [Patescibacteria group bacterium]HAM96540.1 hypothetical protein [Patescibacteria group bacterium]